MPPRQFRLFALLLLAGFALMALLAAPRVGLTFDEPAHLAAGRAYWTKQDYRLHAENGILPQRLAALPAEWRQAAFRVEPATSWQQGDVWGIARHHLFESGQDPARLTLEARAVIVFCAVLLLIVIWRWAAVLWGEAGGLLALVGAAFCPHLLAHGALVTSDLLASLGFFAAVLAWWRLFHRVSVGRVLATGVATGLLALAKFSAVLLAPMVLVLLVVRLARRTDLVVTVGRSRRLAGRVRGAVLGAAALLAVIIAWTVVWAAYGFRFTAHGAGEPTAFAQPWSEVLIETPRRAVTSLADGTNSSDGVQLRPGIVQAFVRAARDFRILPEAYLYGLAFTDRYSRNRLAYFAGEYRESGWREFFPAAFLLKTPLPVLMLAVLGVLGWYRMGSRRWRLLYRLAPLLGLAGVYGSFAITSSLNIGHRHLLPLYPVLYVVVGAAALLTKRRVALVVVVLLGLWQAAESLRVWPHHLTYFNQLAGGPANGHRFLVDSSLDWGQALPDLHDWLAENRREQRVYLSYFGTDEPAQHGIIATRIGDVYFDHNLARPALPALTPGVYCISATMLHRVYTDVRGPWTASFEASYVALLRLLEANAARSPDSLVGADGRPLAIGDWRKELTRLEQLRFGRLCRYLERRAPDATVANSLFVYRLSEAELNAALLGPVN